MRSGIPRNIAVLRQGEALLSRLSDAAFRRHLPPVFGSSIGAHIRHNLDHYACFLNGLRIGHIDYAARSRDARIETDRAAALDAFARTLRDLDAVPPDDGALSVCVGAATGLRRAPTSIARELDFLLSHTIHHYAIVAIMCRLQDIDVDEGFGVAPSTLEYRVNRGSPCVL